ncbi:T9SS type A sorting domain-containing protein [Aurantibacter crassamenti]|uniref:T9SS type A sorting domain-containing protein n=1 Tax=Aurantibacter crassamenti TaxID=1837375 RepID=UPI00193AD2C1|nr:T9SS type A sorting domain-containing protein [Aurantibacter crassamenti]MBM1105949.1 T9SS type A sorting domain-containing protein [Aurantibacter crassamenti]
MKRIIFFLVFVFTLSFAATAQSEATPTAVVQKIKVFPNPASNVVNILGLKNSSRAQIIVSDTYGNAILEHHWAIRNNALNIPITTLRSGIYIVTIQSQEQQVQTKFYKK